jgi:hypothetical protein
MRRFLFSLIILLILPEITNALLLPFAAKDVKRWVPCTNGGVLILTDPYPRYISLPGPYFVPIWAKRFGPDRIYPPKKSTMLLGGYLLRPVYCHVPGPFPPLVGIGEVILYGSARASQFSTPSTSTTSTQP